MLAIAFKEWAVICQALAEGRQAIILRKGGIAEVGNTFQPDHASFWLYPTWTHQQEHGVKPDALPLLQQVANDRPVAGTVRMSCFADVPGVFHAGSLEAALALDDLHFWKEETVRQRFEYRHPGLYVLPVRVYRMPRTFELIETPAYAGCKSWVELEQGLPTEGTLPVLSEQAFRDVLYQLETRLNPTALA
jgi:hypothetical protein